MCSITTINELDYPLLQQIKGFYLLSRNRLQEESKAQSKLLRGLSWEEVLEKLEVNLDALESLSKMEESGGEPDVVSLDEDVIAFYDCASETPLGRRSLCYDQAALDSRKKNKPEGSAMGMAEEMGVEMLDETEYARVQAVVPFDQKTSSWIASPDSIRKLGGALFGDRRYDRVFTYHNGAEYYYSARGFRAKLKLK